MFRGGFFVRILGVILLLVLLAVGGYAIHQAGVAQGYALGLQAAGGEPGSLPEGVPDRVPPMLYPGYGWYGYGYARPFFGGFGFIFPLFFGLLFLFLITRLIFRPFWGWGWGGPSLYWKYHGEAPPWAKDQEKGEEKPDKNVEG